MKRVIAIDVDDVLADSTDHLRNVVNTILGVNLSVKDYRISGEYWGYYERVWQKHSLGELITFDIVNAHSNMAKDQSDVHPVAMSKKVISSLSKNNKLIIVTSRDVAWRVATENWIKIHYGDLFSEVLFTGDRKQEGYKSKGDLCAEYGASWLIDDNVEHCKSAEDKGIKTILFGEYGWHQGILLTQKKCKNWLEVGEFFNGQTI